MTKLMKVCIGNNQRIDFRYLCLDVGITKKKGRILRKSFEAMNELFIFISFCI